MQNKIIITIIVLLLIKDFGFATGSQPSPHFFAPLPEIAPNMQNSNVEKLYAPAMQPDIKLENIVPLIKGISKEEIKKQANTLPPEHIGLPFKAGASTEVQAYQKISLPEAIDYALSHNLDIIGTRLNIDLAKNNVKTANRLQNPYLPFWGNTGKAAEDNPNTIGLMIPIEIAKRGPRKNLAKSSLKLTQGQVLLSELYLRLDVRRAYVDLVAAKTNLKILDDQRKLLQDLVIITQKKYKAGASPAIDIIHAKMTLNQILIQVNSAKTDVLVARYKFNLILESTGFDTKEDYLPKEKEFVSLLTPDPSGKMPDFECVSNLAMTKRLDIINAKQEIDVSQKKLTTIVRKRVPDIELGGGLMYVPSQKSTSRHNTDGLYANCIITNIPLLYLYNPEIKNAKIEVEQKEIAYNNTKHHALMNLHSAYANFIAAQTNLNYYNDVILTESNQFLLMARRSYEIGKTSITDYIFIEQSYKNIMLGYTAALSNYYNSWVEVLREVNDEEFKLNG